MTAHAAPHQAPDPHSPSDPPHKEASKLHIYVQIAMVLSVITGIEVVLVYLPLPAWIVIAALAVLSAVKFMYVIFYFMHLRWDKVFCTILFFIGLVLAVGTMWALLMLFGAEAGKPLTATMGLLLP